jgi:hypothetical protein
VDLRGTYAIRGGTQKKLFGRLSAQVLEVKDGGQIGVVDDSTARNGPHGGTHGRLGAKGDAEAGGLKHGYIVGAVADRYNVAGFEAEAGGEVEQDIALCGCIEDRFEHTAGQTAAFDFEGVGEHAVEAEIAGDRFGEDGKAASDKGREGAIRFHGGNESGSAGHRRDARGGRCKIACGKPGEMRHAGYQGRHKVAFAAHRCGGERCDAVAAACNVSEFVDHFLLDNGRFHIGNEQPLGAVSRGHNVYIDGPRGKVHCYGIHQAPVSNADFVGCPRLKPLACRSNKLAGRAARNLIERPGGGVGGQDEVEGTWHEAGRSREDVASLVCAVGLS